LQTISDNVLEAIITIDTSATIISCNRAVESLFGWTVPELLGQNVKVLCPEPYRTEHDAYVYEYVSGGPPRIIGLGREVPAQRKDRTSFAAELTVSEVRQAGKRIFIGVLRDISERKRAENLLKENAEKLQRYYESTESENQLAHTLIERQLLREDLDDPLVHYWLTPAENFSGDVIAATRSSSGRLYAVLADATGHGLTAAISTLPVSGRSSSSTRPSARCRRRGNRTSGCAGSRRCDWHSAGQALRTACRRCRGRADGRTPGDGSPALGFLPRVIRGSTTRRNSLALGRVVLMSLVPQQRNAMLRSIA
jgi:PAS domain S-box-containing protein